MAQLSREHDELAAMMRFMSNEVIEKVHEVSRKVLPECRWDCATVRYP